MPCTGTYLSSCGETMLEPGDVSGRCCVLAGGCPHPTDTCDPSSAHQLPGGGHIVPRDKETASAALERLPLSAAFMEVQPRVCCAFSAFLGLWRRKRKAFCVWGLVWFSFDPFQRWCNLGEPTLYFKVLFRLQRFNCCSTGVS